MKSNLKASVVRGGAVVVLLSALFLAVGCGSAQEVQVDADDDGRQIALDQGQVLVVTLGSNPSTGYGWQVAEVQEAILKQTGETEFQESNPGGTPVVGAGGTETLRFEALKAGQTTLKLVYHRAWEKDVEPLDAFSVQVVVR